MPAAVQTLAIDALHLLLQGLIAHVPILWPCHKMCSATNCTLVLQVEDMVNVLELAGSSYLGPFLELKEVIHHEAVAAQDNVKYLACLEGPCQQLSKATPVQIPALLPQILDCIRMVWSLSRFYNTPERLTGLLRKLSNEVINRCCAALKLNDIFDGDVQRAMETLQQSMSAGGQQQRARLLCTQQTCTVEVCNSSMLHQPASPSTAVCGSWQLQRA